MEKLTRILDERQGKYSFADIQVPLQSEEHGSLAAEAVVVAYRYGNREAPYGNREAPYSHRVEIVHSQC